MRPAFLFDLDGVIFDTEGQYSVLWDEIGKEHFSDSGFAGKIKGQTLVRIFDLYFKDNLPLQEEIRDRLYRLEREMDYRYVPGVEDFLSELKSAGYPAAVVTSSNRDKMAQVYKARPEIRDIVKYTFTGEDFAKSKPDPDCYRLGTGKCGCGPENTFVFEDSFNGLLSGLGAGCKVIALATTNSREAVAPYADLVVDDFSHIASELEKAFGLKI